MTNILFRADSSSTIGTGHIKRDLVLANQFQNAHIIFATQNLQGNINQEIKDKNYRVEILNSKSISELIKLIKVNSIDTIVIDHYGINYNDEKKLKDETGINIFVLDDTYEKHYCDILLNHNIGADETRYKNLVPPNCELRCGTKYTLLREEFIQEKRKKNITTSSIKNILIAMGGADHSNINIHILKVLKAFPAIHADVVTTTANKNLDDLRTYALENHNVTLHINTNQMARLMNQADFAIVTPSVTVNEVLFMQLPFIAIKTADNQKEIYDYLVKNNYFGLPEFNALELKKTLEDLLHG